MVSIFLDNVYFQKYWSMPTTYHVENQVCVSLMCQKKMQKQLTDMIDKKMMQSPPEQLPFGAPQRRAYKPELFKEFLGNFQCIL